MKKEIIYSYTIIGMILIITGIFSFVYGYIIPTENFPINNLPNLFYRILGIIFIIFGLILVTFLKKREMQKKMIAPNEGIET